jgi:uncharacterized protein involved in exopolysaccharide biosynthesis
MKSLGDTGLLPLNYLKIFFRRKELVLIPAFIGLVLGACTGILLPKKYKSSTVILVQEGKSDNPLFEKLAVSTTVEQRLAGIRETILGWTSLSELVKRLDLDKDVRTKLEFEELIKNIQKNIKIRLRGGNILYLDYVGEDPEQTQAVVKNITDIFISKNQEAQDLETADAILFIEEQLHVYRGKIKSAEIAQLQERLDALLLDSTVKHPLVKELQEQIRAKKDVLKKENLEYTENADLRTQDTKPMIAEIKQALDTLEGQTLAKKTNSKTPDSMLTLNLDLEKVVARDVNVNEQIYNMLLQRLETAKITQRLQSSKEGTHYRIIDPPRIPLSPFKPNRILIALVGMFLGTVGGAGLVLATEFLDKSFIDVEEAKEYLGVALFGAISKINTPESLKREREKERWLYGLTFVVGVVMVAVTLQISHFIK